MSNGDPTYTQAGIMAQIWVAFGQGTGATRVSQEAAMALHNRYYNRIVEVNAPSSWAAEAVQVLERIRAIGRLAAYNALQRGDTAISSTDVDSASSTVELQSETELCPPRIP